ncbi:MAG TPA: PHB depolymerase family esterase [Candidatus Solibacter sp.]|nr:PHB depolymerase family esterase [Candidatus Solibacter sp.]
MLSSAIAFWLASGGLLAPPATATQPSLSYSGPGEGPPLEAAPAATPRGHFHPWTGTPSDVAGGIAFSPGEVIVTDAPFDDHGADTNANDASPGENYTLLQGANSAKGAAGDYAYPTDADPAHPVYGKNAADIVETRLGADGNAWYLLVRLNMMNDPTITAIEAKIDGHDLVVHGQQGALDGQAVDVFADTKQSLFEVRVPRAVYDPGLTSHKVFVAAGLWDKTNNTWYHPSSGGSPYYDLAYVPNETMTGYWHDVHQSADIAAQSYANDSFSVDFGALERGTCPSGMSCPGFSGPTHGLINRVFRSGQPLGSGVTLQTRWNQDQGGLGYQLYRSPYQPYTVYVPQHRSGATVFLLHYLGGNHMSYAITSMNSAPPNDAISTAGSVGDWAEKLGVTVVMPLARGEAGWYESEAEKDFFEVWRDFAAHYGYDPERVYLSGMSMGGHGTWRLGQLYPDLFASAIVWSGTVAPDTIWVGPPPAPVMYSQQNPPACNRDSPGCGYSLIELFGNSRNIPYHMIHGGMDELVPIDNADAWLSKYCASSGGSCRYVFYPTHRHETSYPGTTEHFVLEWLNGLPTRVQNPGHVSYIVQRRFMQPDLGGFSYQGAYWVSGMKLAGGASEGVIDADRSAAPAARTDFPDAYQVDNMGPYRLRAVDVAQPAVAANAVKLQLNGLSAATLDTNRMGWDLSAAQHVTGKSDTAMDLTIAGPYDPPVVTGAPSSLTTRGLVLHLPAGPFDVTIGPDAGAVAGARLPNTSGGGMPALPGLALILTVTALFAASFGWRGWDARRI